MAIEEFFKIKLKFNPCIEGISEDAIRRLFEAVEITVADPDFKGFVRSSNGTEVTFMFGPDGNFAGEVAKINGKNVTLVSGANTNQLALFKGAPSATNPGPGWLVEYDLTQRYLSPPPVEANWELFLASRTAVLNTL